MKREQRLSHGSAHASQLEHSSRDLNNRRNRPSASQRHGSAQQLAAAGETGEGGVVMPSSAPGE
jgi:hypothetical protein